MNGTTLSPKSIVRSHPQTSLTVGVALLVVLVSVLGTLSQAAGLVVRVEVFALVIAVVAVGDTTRWGVFLGFLVAGGLANDWTGGAVTGLAGLLTVLVLSRLWVSPNPRAEPGTWALLYGASSLLAVVVYAAFVGALGDLAGRVPFYAGLLSAAQLNLAPAVLSLPVAWVANTVTVDTGLHSEVDPAVTPRRRLAVAVILLWTVCAFLGSFMYRAVSLVTAERLAKRTHPVVETLLELSGPHGVRTVFLFNLAAVTVVMLLLYRGAYRDISGRWPVPWN